MDHDYIERRRVIERYVTDRLSMPERVAFEEHYIACERCLDHLEEAEGTPATRRPDVNASFRCGLIRLAPVVHVETARNPPKPQIDPASFVVPVFLLKPASEDSGSNSILAKGRFVLCLGFAPDSRATRFDARVADQSGRIVTITNGITAPPSGCFGLTLHSSGFRAGRYFVTVTGRTENEEAIQTARFVFTFAETAGSTDGGKSSQ